MTSLPSSANDSHSTRPPLRRTRAAYAGSGVAAWLTLLLACGLLACGGSEVSGGPKQAPEAAPPVTERSPALPGAMPSAMPGGDAVEAPSGEAMPGEQQPTGEGPPQDLPRAPDGSGGAAPPAGDGSSGGDGAADPPNQPEPPDEPEAPPDDGMQPADDGAMQPDPTPDPPANQLPLLRIPVRVHLGGDGDVPASALTGAQLGPIFAEMNSIWQSQARICFEFETTEGLETLRAEDRNGFDLWFTSNLTGSNGVYRGRRDRAFSDDAPGLGARGVENPAVIAAARTAAHELGHGLGLPHNNCTAGEAAPPLDACREFLMASGTRGTLLLEGTRELDGVQKNEISTARSVAQAQNQRLALPDTSVAACAAPIINRD